jgi:hypothetical protein
VDGAGLCVECQDEARAVSTGLSFEEGRQRARTDPTGYIRDEHPSFDPIQRHQIEAELIAGLKSLGGIADPKRLVRSWEMTRNTLDPDGNEIEGGEPGWRRYLQASSSRAAYRRPEIAPDLGAGLRLAAEPKILQRFAEAAAKLGLVGEESNAKLLFLVALYARGRTIEPREGEGGNNESKPTELCSYGGSWRGPGPAGNADRPSRGGASRRHRNR